jgi:hypothetical protein
MSFASAVTRFATQAAAERTQIFSGEVNASGNNLQIGSTPFRAAFTLVTTGYELLPHGKHVRCDAKFLLPASVDVTLTVNTTVTHLPTGDVFDVVEFRPNTVTPETIVYLQRQEP